MYMDKNKTEMSMPVPQMQMPCLLEKLMFALLKTKILRWEHLVSTCPNYATELIILSLSLNLTFWAWETGLV